MDKQEYLKKIKNLIVLCKKYDQICRQNEALEKAVELAPGFLNKSYSLKIKKITNG